MEPTTFIAGLLAFWSLFHLLQNFIMGNTTLATKYAGYLVNNNISISFCHVRWFSKRWNHKFLKVGKWRKFPVKHWFNFGVLFAVIAMGLSTSLLCKTLFSSLQKIIFKDKDISPNTQVLTVIVPGVNLPLNDIGYLILAVFINGILHECGHAIAAAKEGIPMNGFGVFIFVIYPGAFVDLNSNELNAAHPLCKLRIYCAGVWHNFVTCLLACILILSLPHILFPVYSQSDSGAFLTYQSSNSPIKGEHGLILGDFVTQIDDCEVSNVEDWFYCMNRTMKTSHTGSCVNQNTIDQLEYKSNFDSEDQSKITEQKYIDCCGNDGPVTHLCYQYFGRNSATLNYSYACLPGRTVILNHSVCLDNNDCKNHKGEKEKYCLLPYLAPQVKFGRIKGHRTMSAGTKQFEVLFLGDLREVLVSTTMSDFVPRFYFVPRRFPEFLLRFFQYMFSISGALALLNIVPCYALDGQWAFNVLFDYGLSDKKRLNPQLYDIILHVILTSGTVLLAANIIVGFYYIFTV